MNIRDYISSGIIELYVMGLCSPEEEKEFESLRIKYPELNIAVIDYENILEFQLQKDAQLPTAATDEKILTALDTLSVSGKDNRQPSIYNINWWKRAAIAASLLLGFSIVYTLILVKKVNRLDKIVLAPGSGSALPPGDYEIMLNPAITPVGMYGVGSHAICRCTMFWDKKTGKAYIMIHHLPKSSESKDYQLWAMIDDKPVNVGIINDEIRGRFIEVNNMPKDAKNFVVTLEKSGGSITPNMEEMYLMGRI